MEGAPSSSSESSEPSLSSPDGKESVKVASVDCVSIEDGPSLSDETSSYSSTMSLFGVNTFLPDRVVVTYALSVSG